MVYSQPILTCYVACIQINHKKSAVYCCLSKKLSHEDPQVVYPAEDELRLHEMQKVCVLLFNERDAFCNKLKTLNFAVKPFLFNTVMVPSKEMLFGDTT